MSVAMRSALGVGLKIPALAPGVAGTIGNKWQSTRGFRDGRHPADTLDHGRRQARGRLWGSWGRAIQTFVDGVSNLTNRLAALGVISARFELTMGLCISTAAKAEELGDTTHIKPESIVPKTEETKADSISEFEGKGKKICADFNSTGGWHPDHKCPYVRGDNPCKCHCQPCIDIAAQVTDTIHPLLSQFSIP
ncbi:hypothetical protein EV122DRAFT_277235 [Schizophyllum commune]